LVGANVGEQQTMTARPEPLSGFVERMQDEKQRYVMMRLDALGPGIAR
jgi:hypothetical protein